VEISHWNRLLTETCATILESKLIKWTKQEVWTLWLVGYCSMQLCSEVKKIQLESFMLQLCCRYVSVMLQLCCSYVAVMLQLCCSYVAVMLQLCLRHDFYNVIFKSKHKLSTASGPAPPNQIKKSGCAPATHCPAITVYVVTGSAGCT